LPLSRLLCSAGFVVRRTFEEIGFTGFAAGAGIFRLAGFFFAAALAAGLAGEAPLAGVFVFLPIFFSGVDARLGENPAAGAAENERRGEYVSPEARKQGKNWRSRFFGKEHLEFFHSHLCCALPV